MSRETILTAGLEREIRFIAKRRIFLQYEYPVSLEADDTLRHINEAGVIQVLLDEIDRLRDLKR